MAMAPKETSDLISATLNIRLILSMKAEFVNPLRDFFTSTSTPYVVADAAFPKVKALAPCDPAPGINTVSIGLMKYL